MAGPSKTTSHTIHIYLASASSYQRRSEKPAGSLGTWLPGIPFMPSSYRPFFINFTEAAAYHGLHLLKLLSRRFTSAPAPRARSNAFLRVVFDESSLRFLRGHAVPMLFLAANLALGLCPCPHFAARLWPRFARAACPSAVQAAHLFHLLQLRQEVVEVKAVTALSFSIFARPADRRLASHLFDQRHDVAHAQHAPGVALGVEHFEAVDFSRHPGEL